MLFNSLDFLLFFGIVLSLYYVLPLTGRLIMLLAASLYFYMYWNVPYVGLLLLSSVVDYTAGRGLGVTTRPASAAAAAGEPVRQPGHSGLLQVL